MASTKLMIMLPLMFAARKLDGDDPSIVFMLRCSYGIVQFFILLSVIHVYLCVKRFANGKYKDNIIYVAPPPNPLDPDAKKQYKKTTFGEHASSTARSLVTSTIFGICMTTGLHLYKGMIVGLAMQSVMGPFSLFEKKLAKAILLQGSMKEEDTPKSRRFFDEKYLEELDSKDEIVDGQGRVVVAKKEKAAKPAKKTFEDILLDTWDSGEEKVDFTALLNALNKSNVNYKTKENGWTPLMITAGLGGAKKSGVVIKKLKELGANASIVDGDGWNALHWAAFHGSMKGAECLLENFGSAAGLQDVKDKEGKTPVEHATAEKNHDVVEVLEAISDAGAGGGLADKDGLRKRK